MDTPTNTRDGSSWIRRTTCIRSPTSSSSPPRARASSRARRASTSTPPRATRSSTACPACGAWRSATAARNCPMQPTSRCRSCRTTTASSSAARRRRSSWREPQGSHAAAVQPCVLHGLGQRGQRHHGAAGAPLLAAAGPAGAQCHRFTLEWLSRQHHRRRVARRHEAHARAGAGGALPGIVHINQPYWFGEGGDLSPAEFGLTVRARARSKILRSARIASPPSSASRCRAPAA